MAENQESATHSANNPVNLSGIEYSFVPNNTNTAFNAPAVTIHAEYLPILRVENYGWWKEYKDNEARIFRMSFPYFFFVALLTLYYLYVVILEISAITGTASNPNNSFVYWFSSFFGDLSPQNWIIQEILSVSILLCMGGFFFQVMGILAFFLRSDNMLSTVMIANVVLMCLDGLVIGIFHDALGNVTLLLLIPICIKFVGCFLYYFMFRLLKGRKMIFQRRRSP